LRASGGFDTAGFENLSGIETLAKEVGAQSTSAFNTPASTLTQYGAGAPVSTPLTSATPFNPAAPMANPTYAQSGLQGLQTNLSGPLGSNLPPPSVTQAVTSAGTDAASQQTVREGMLNNYANPNIGESVFESPYVQQPVEPEGKSLYDLNGIATGNPSPPIDNPLAPNQITRYAPPGGMQMRDVVAKDAVEWAGGNANQIASAATPAAAPEAGGLEGLWKDFKAMPLKDKAMYGYLGSAAYQMMNQPKPYEKPKYKSTFNSGAYSGYNPTPPTPYTPNYAHGGLADLGGYSDGGRMLKGPGDGMSDDIPATIANKQPARLANEEFVVPADVVSHLGNGSSEAGAKVLYKMMDRVRQARTGNKKQGKQINPEKYLA
jgi:hypothetical protein